LGLKPCAKIPPTWDWAAYGDKAYSLRAPGWFNANGLSPGKFNRASSMPIRAPSLPSEKGNAITILENASAPQTSVKITRTIGPES
jgi:hypothetical protein